MKIKNKDVMETLEDVTRVEVIDEHGRSYVHYNAGVVKYSLQDEGTTLKIFIEDGDYEWQQLRRNFKNDDAE